MTICGYVTIGYFLVGIILAYIWWKDEYEAEYDYEKEIDGVEEPMAVLLIAGFVFFWPFKLVKNYFESLVE